MDKTNTHAHTERGVTLGLQLLNSFLFNDSSAFGLWMPAPDASTSVPAMMRLFFNILLLFFCFFNKAQRRQHRGRRGAISYLSALVEVQFNILQTNRLPARYGETPSAAPTRIGQSPTSKERINNLMCRYRVQVEGDTSHLNATHCCSQSWSQSSSQDCKSAGIMTSQRWPGVTRSQGMV